MKKLTMVGDSVLKGITYSGERKRYSVTNDSLFSEELRDKGYELFKKCKMGATVAYGLDALDKLSPEDMSDVVIVGFGGNDCNFNWQEVSSSPSGLHLPMTDEKTFERLYRSLLEKAKSFGGKVFCQNLVPIDAEKYMAFIATLADRDKVLSWLGDVSMLYRYHEHYNMLAERVALSCGCEIIDVRSAFLENHSFKNLICDDGLHPTDEGYRIIREEIVRAI